MGIIIDSRKKMVRAFLIIMTIAISI